MLFNSKKELHLGWTSKTSCSERSQLYIKDCILYEPIYVQCPEKINLDKKADLSWPGAGSEPGIDCNRHEGSSFQWQKMFLNQIVVAVTQIYKFTKCKLNKLVNFMMCKLYLSKTVREKGGERVCLRKKGSQMQMALTMKSRQGREEVCQCWPWRILINGGHGHWRNTYLITFPERRGQPNHLLPYWEAPGLVWRQKRARESPGQGLFLGFPGKEKAEHGK